MSEPSSEESKGREPAAEPAGPRYPRLRTWGAWTVGTIGLVGSILTIVSFLPDEPPPPSAALAVEYRTGEEDGAYEPIAELEDALEPGALLKLSVQRESGCHAYLLSVDGTGEPRIDEVDARERAAFRPTADGAVEIQWEVSGPPSAETIVVLVSRDEIDTDDLLAAIRRKGLAPAVPDGYHIVFGPGGAEAVRDASGARGIRKWREAKEMRWAYALHDLISELGDIGIAGHTVPVKPVLEEE